MFEFVRVEDIAYDRRPGMQNVASTSSTAAAARRSRHLRPAIPVAQPLDERSSLKLVLDKDDPTKVTSFSILIEGDDAPVKAPNEIHQPDNIESTATSLLITEDPGRSAVPGWVGRAYAANFDPRATTARIRQYDLRPAGRGSWRR